MSGGGRSPAPKKLEYRFNKAIWSLPVMSGDMVSSVWLTTRFVTDQTDGRRTKGS